MAAAAYIDQVQQLYIAYFGRPADTVGLAYWSNQIDTANGSLTAAIAGFSASAESNALYSGVSTAQKVNAIYLNLFNRLPEASGLAYWAGLIDSGSVSHAQAAYQIQSSAGPGDARAVANKLAVAKAFTAQIDTTAEIAGYSGATSSASARAFLSQIDATDYTLNFGNTGAPDALAKASGTVPIVTAPAPAPVPLFSVTENALTHVLEFSGAATGSITMSMPDATHVFFSRGGIDTASVALTTVTGINLPTDAITLTYQQASDLRAASVKFDATDAVTVAGIFSGNEAASLTNFTTTLLGGSSVTLDAFDNTWNVSATSLAAASAGNIVLAASDVVTITNVLFQGNQTINAGSFQSGNDKLYFTAITILLNASFTAAPGGALSILGNNFNLVVGMGPQSAPDNGTTFLFNTTSGQLSLDFDGVGLLNPTPLLTLTGVTTLAATDFVFA